MARGRIVTLAYPPTVSQTSFDVVVLGSSQPPHASDVPTLSAESTRCEDASTADFAGSLNLARR